MQSYIYIILLTAKGLKEDIVRGINAGADDYLTKPFNNEELRIRIKAGERIIKLEEELAGRINEFKKSLDKIRQLQEIIPICMHCNKIRYDDKYWIKLEEYIQKYSGSDFSHGICPECLEIHYPDYILEKIEESEK